MKAVVLTLVVLTAGYACGKGDQPAQSRINRDTLTQRQKDSLLAASSIPGAPVVGRAIRAADSASAHARATDSVP